MHNSFDFSLVLKLQINFERAFSPHQNSVLVIGSYKKMMIKKSHERTGTVKAGYEQGTCPGWLAHCSEGLDDWLSWATSLVSLGSPAELDCSALTIEQRYSIETMQMMIQKWDINKSIERRSQLTENPLTWDVWEAVATDGISHLQGYSHRSQSVV